MVTRKINRVEIEGKEIKVNKTETNQEGYITKVTLSWGEIKIPFQCRQSNKPERADANDPCAPRVPTKVYQEMIKRAAAILGQKRKTNKAVILIKPIRAEKIQEARLREWLYCLEAAGIKILENGHLRINYWIKKPGQPLKNEPRTLPDIHSAIRQQAHILKNYREDINGQMGELNKIYSIEGLISHVNHLLRNWTALDSTEKEKIKAKLTIALSLLGRCRRESKVRAKEKVIELIPLRDKLGRLNPGVMATKTISALGFVVQRLEEINAIAPIIALRQELLTLENRRLWANIRKCKETLEFILKKHFLNEKIAIPSKKQRAFINTLFGQALYPLNNLWCSPYFEMGKQIKNLIRMAKLANLGDNQLQTVKYLKMAVYTAEHTLKENPPA